MNRGGGPNLARRRSATLVFLTRAHALAYREPTSSCCSFIPLGYAARRSSPFQMRPVALPDSGTMGPKVVELHDESRCPEIDSFLADRTYEFNAKATGYADGRCLAGTIQDDTGRIVAGLSGHTWGGCCEITHLWVHAASRPRPWKGACPCR
jgi:hypothetical protein